MARAAQISAVTADEEKPVVGRPFPKGKSGNPGGRPKGLASAVRETLKVSVGEGEDPALGLARFAVSVLGDPKAKMEHRLEAMKWLGDRGYGKAPQFAPIEDGDPLEVSEQEMSELAAAFEERLDELAERRRSKKKP